ncbi:MAG: hypothetical protein EBZ48_17930 [Proteobacteria bacterium]|nr:hypothetical protein [Pseudomonadota bacterium]
MRGALVAAGPALGPAPRCAGLSMCKSTALPCADATSRLACEQAYMQQCEVGGAAACAEQADGFCTRAFDAPTVKEAMQTP